MVPAGFEVVRLDHVNITAPGELIEEVVSWYESCLGLKRLEKPEGTRQEGAWFQAGNEEIHVSLDEHNPPEKAHFGIVVNDFTGVVDALRGSGCHLEQASTIPGRRRCFTRDPAGNRIEIIAFDADRARVGTQ